MPFFDPIRIGASGAADTAFTVDRSLRFNSGDSPELTRTPSGAGNRRTWTLSFWAKISDDDLGSHGFLFSTGADASNKVQINIESSNRITFEAKSGGSTQANIRPSNNLRDVSAWYHFVIRVDTTDSTSTNRIKFYINGTQQTDLASNTFPSQHTEFEWNKAQEHNIGKRTYSSNYFNGYLAEINFIDGTALTPSSFGETNADTGQWVPIDTSGLTFGTNGFRLQFADNSGTTATTLGKDTSGNSNNFTPNNFSVSAGAGNDSVSDTPTNNFATLNSLNFNGNSPSNGNLQSGTAGTTGWRHTYATFAMPSSGKWYWEVTRQGGSIDGSNGICYGLADSVEVELTRDINSNSNNLYLRQNDSRYNNGTITGSHFAAPSVGNVIQFAFDADTGSMWSGVNNTWTGANPSTGSSASWTSIPSGMVPLVGSYGSNNYSTINFGQQGFTYTPPTGYKALSSANLPDPTILLPNKHFDTLLWTGDASYPRVITGLQFQPDWHWTKTRNQSYGHGMYDSVRGTGSSKALRPDDAGSEGDASIAPYIDLSSFNSNGVTYADPSDAIDIGNGNGYTIVGWNWNAGDTDGKTYTVKVVSDSGNKYRFDDFGTSAVTLDLAEGGTYVFDWSDSSAQSHPIRFSTTSDGTHGGGSEYTTGVTKDDSAYKTTITVAASAPQLYYYCQNHSGMGGAVNTNSTLGSSNFDGTIQSVAKVNASAGFSITAYNGNNSAGATIGHGLGVVPSVLIVKNRDSARGWMVYHHKNTSAPATEYLWLDQASATSDYDGSWNDTAPTSTVFSIGNSNETNENNSDHIAYCFSEVAGYSKFGSYTGNGSSDGTFVFTGFKPAFILTKSTTSTHWWEMADNTRVEFNPRDKTLYSNRSDAEYSGSQYNKDFLSNGFKARSDNGGHNGSGNTYIYLAFAESPFKNTRAG